MRTSRGAVVGAIALTLLAATPASPAAAAAPTAPYKVWSLSGTWDVVGTSDNTAYLSLQAYNTDGILINMSHDGSSYMARIQPRTGQTLAVGTFATKRFADATYGALDVTGRGSGCNTNTGSVTIHEISRDAESGGITSLALSYSQDSCLPLRGEFRWNSAQGYTATTATSRRFEYGTVTAGSTSAARTVTFRSHGSTALQFGTAALTGTHAGAYAITADSCSGATLAYDETCAVSLAAAPEEFGSLTAALELPSNTVGGKESVSLFTIGAKSNAGTFYPVSPERLMDTRNGTGVPAAPVGPGGTIHLQVTGRGNVPPSGVSAVVLNVTVTAPTTSGHVTVYPTGVTRPVASSLNFTKGWTGANSVTVAVGDGGRVSLFNSAGSTHLIADVVGWYADDTVVQEWDEGGLLHHLQPQRWLDTRTWGYGPLGAYEYVQLFTDFGPGNEHVKAWVVNVTSTGAKSGGYLAAWNGDEYQLPNSSTLNFTAGQTVSNFAVVPARQCWECAGELSQWYGWSTIGVYTNAATHVIVDVFAVYDDGWDPTGLRLQPTTPRRIVDSRTGLGVPSALGARSTATVTPPADLLGEYTYGLSLNVTAVQPTYSTYVTVWPHGAPQPVVSNLNPARGQIVPNAVVVGLGDGDAFDVYNNAGTVNFVIDVVGTFYWYPYGVELSAAQQRTQPKNSLAPGGSGAIKRH